MEREVLLVESHAELADVIRQMLQHLGVSARVVPTTAMAKRQVKSTAPAMVLLDAGPRGRCEFIRMSKADQTTAAIPVVAMTLTGTMTCQDAIRAGADDCIDQLEFSQLERVLRKFGLITGGSAER